MCLFVVVNERGSLSVATWCFCSSNQPLTSSGVTHGRVTSSVPLITCVLTGAHTLSSIPVPFTAQHHIPPSLVSLSAPTLALSQLAWPCLALTFDPSQFTLRKLPTSSAVLPRPPAAHLLYGGREGLGTL